MEVHSIPSELVDNRELLYPNCSWVILFNNFRIIANEGEVGIKGYFNVRQADTFGLLFGALRTGTTRLLCFSFIWEKSKHGQLSSSYRHIHRPYQVVNLVAIYAYRDRRSFEFPLPQEQAIITTYHKFNSHLRLSSRSGHVHPPTLIGLQES